MKAKPLQLLQVVVIIFLAVIIVSEATIFVPQVAGKVSLSVTITSSGGNVSVESEVTSPYTAAFLQSFLVGPGATPVHVIYYYFDSAYGYANVGIVTWFGLSGHLGAIISERHLPITVVIVNATGLEKVFLQPPSTDSIVVVASGAFPDTVMTNSTNLVRPWIEAGGRLFWVGAPIGFYSAHPGYPVKYPPYTWDPGQSGVYQFLNSSYLGAPSSGGTVYENATLTSTALQVSLTNGIGGGFEFNQSGVSLAGGQLLSNTADGWGNGALLPMGKGWLVDWATTVGAGSGFGIARTLINLVQLGFFEGVHQVLLNKQVLVSAGIPSSWSYDVQLPVGFITPPWEVYAVFTQQVGVAATFAQLSA